VLPELMAMEHPSNPCTSGGYSLIELLITVAIMSTLSLIALPSFAQLVAWNRVKAQAHEFLTDVTLARSEAVRRGQRVTMCKSADGQGCAEDGEWDQGWIVFVESVLENGTVDEGEEILVVRGMLTGGSTLSGVGGLGSPMRTYVSYTPLGFSEQIGGLGQSGTIRLCNKGRGVQFVLFRTGRMRTEETSCP
jgi:type IV fimbrial biogenesis protein FimT